MIRIVWYKISEISFKCYSGVGTVEISILTGTILGFLSKYYLDRKYIFFYRFVNLKNDFKILSLYIFMSVIATLIFWSVEVLFDQIFEVRYMRYVGAILGLSIGYTIKYVLDRRFVFVVKSH